MKEGSHEFDLVKLDDIDTIKSRLEGVTSEKVREKVENTYLPKIRMVGEGAQMLFTGIKKDLELAIKDPEAEAGGGWFNDWSEDEIQELHLVLFGEKVQKDT